MADANIQLIKDKINVGDLVGEYIQLKPAGTNLKGLCPFHSEKTGSFMVSREKQIWHCFGCAKGGDIFTFVQEIEGMDFVEALRLLANRAGVELETYRSEINKSQKNRLFEINIQALRFFYNFLDRMPVAQGARDYLKKRSLTKETIDAWQIGFAVDQWDLLTRYLLKKGFSIDDLVASGLTIKRDNANRSSGRGFYDRFRGRIMFPIWDTNDNVVGFTGRVLEETEKSGGKYVNTPQSPVYDKSAVVFGLNKAKMEIRKQKKVIVVEGQMDVIACWQAGMKNVVASSGTALTERQVSVLKRYTTNMVVSFDGDVAGQNAAKRGVDIARAQDMDVKVLVLPKELGKDPDECIKNSKEAWFGLVENAQDIMHWNFERIFKDKDLNNPKEKQKIADELLEEIAIIPKEVEKDHWIQELSSGLGVSSNVLRDEMKRIVNKKSNKYIAKEEEQFKPVKKEKTRLDKTVEELLILLALFPEFAGTVFDKVDDKYISASDYVGLYELFKKGYNSLGVFDLTKIQNEFAIGDTQISSQILALEGKSSQDVYDFDKTKAKIDIVMAVKNLKDIWFQERKFFLERRLEVANNSGNKDEANKILKELSDLYKNI
jgi:DNA primase